MSAMSVIETAVEAKHNAATRKNAPSDADIHAPRAQGDDGAESAARPVALERDARSAAARRARQPLRLVVGRVAGTADARVAGTADRRVDGAASPPAGASEVARSHVATSRIAVPDRARSGPDDASLGPAASYSAASRGTAAGRIVVGRAVGNGRAAAGLAGSARGTETRSCLARRAQPGGARRQLAAERSSGSLRQSGAGTPVRSIPAGPIRLTRRGRAVAVVGVVTVVVAIALVLLLVIARGAQATSNGRPGAGYQGMHQIVVQPGQTLWAIAQTAEPAANTAAVIQEIMIANAMTGTTLTAGQLLWVPR